MRQKQENERWSFEFVSVESLNVWTREISPGRRFKKNSPFADFSSGFAFVIKCICVIDRDRDKGISSTLHGKQAAGYFS